MRIWTLQVRLSLFLVIIGGVASVIDDGEGHSGGRCTEQTTCDTCMAAHGSCAWCTDDKFVDEAGRKHRCDSLSNLRRRDCQGIEDYGNIVFKQEREDVRDERAGSAAVLISPQRLSLQLRPNTPHKFRLTLREAENYPMDLYYLMDLSHSMGDDKENIAGLGNLLATHIITEITSNVRMGFGSFVDKKAMPYVNIMPDKLVEPCAGCAAPYSFHNVLPLTNNTRLFGEEVRKAHISGNLDGPEGGLDALLQAIVCTKEIGWREDSRRVIIFSTDELSHMAGDGLLGGIVLPNDGQCHMENGRYTHSTLQDYPSLAQIQHKVAENQVNLVFAVTKNRVRSYEKIAEFIHGSVVGELLEDSTNVVKLVEDNYRKITQTLRLHVDGVEDSGLDVTFKSKCFGSQMRETSKCDGMTVGSEVEFEVTLTARRCPPDPTKPLTVRIFRVGITQALVINATVKCQCECQKPQLIEKSSPRCSHGNGTFECGICRCNEGRYGKICECGATDHDATHDYDSSCRRGNDSRVCSGRGTCRCGECLCDYINTRGLHRHRYHGEFCQCNDYSCSYAPDNKLMCGGSSRGKCYCGSCLCEEGWTGAACQCTTSQDKCISSNGELCNGKGTCVCGQCVCDKDIKFGGPTCEDCPSCPALCEDKRNCVQCVVFKSGPLAEKSEPCEQICPNIREVDVLSRSATSRRCQYRDVDGCTFYFNYDYDRLGNVDVQVQRTKECHHQIETWWIIVAVVAAIVLLGLLALIIWRCVVTYLDKQEYQAYLKGIGKFKNEIHNPLYKEPETKFKNPMYKGNAVFDDHRS